MADHVIVVLSDIEMGAGGLADDFPDDRVFADILDERCGRLGPDVSVDLVFNGDTLDFLRVPVSSGFPAHVTSAIACEKLARIERAHAGFFARVHEFLAVGGERTVHFLVGNHDAEVLFPDIQTRLARLCGVPGRVRFPGFELDIGPVHIEHGSQLDPMFAMSADQPFVEQDGEAILSLSWGALAVLDVWGMTKQELFALDRIRPRERLFELLPDARTLLLRRCWKYFAHDFWRDFRNDPVKHVTWTMIKEVIYRFFTADADVSVRGRYLEELQASTAQVYVIGHEHKATRTDIGERTLVTAGCLRDEYILPPDFGPLQPATKGAVEIHLTGDRVDEVIELEYPGSPPPPGYVPDDLRSLEPVLARYLAELEGHTEPPA